MTTPRLATPAAPVRRVILVVADGVRADVIPLLDLPTFSRLARDGVASLQARTVTPSVTAAAMTSLLTGVPPAVHGMNSDRFRIPRPRGPVEPLPMVLRRAGIRSSAWMSRLPWTYRRLATSIVRRVGFDRASFAGEDAAGVLQSASTELRRGRDGFMILHWPDADRAGHSDGWPSPAYGRAVRQLDRCLGQLDALSGASDDPDTLLIVMADHGGGGRRRKHHDSTHSLDVTIPIILAGGRVRSRRLMAGASLLDVPATVLHALGVEVPASYHGRNLAEFCARGHIGIESWDPAAAPLAMAV